MMLMSTYDFMSVSHYSQTGISISHHFKDINILHVTFTSNVVSYTLSIVTIALSVSNHSVTICHWMSV